MFRPASAHSSSFIWRAEVGTNRTWASPLTVGGIAGIVAQTPAGALVDRLRSKRALIAAGIVALVSAALFIALWPAIGSVVFAQVLLGGASSIFAPAVCAISLGIVGHELFDRRQGATRPLAWSLFSWLRSRRSLSGFSFSSCRKRGIKQTETKRLRVSDLVACKVVLQIALIQSRDSSVVPQKWAQRIGRINANHLAT